MHIIRFDSQYSRVTVTATAINIDIRMTAQSHNIFVTSLNNLFALYTNKCVRTHYHVELYGRKTLYKTETAHTELIERPIHVLRRFFNDVFVSSPVVL